jgi:DNA polymerase-3 subunit gamma/tau
VAALARSFAPESVQLAYQICVQGRADLPLAPDEQTGFAMTLLRLLAFEPTDAENSEQLARPARAAPESAKRASSSPAPGQRPAPAEESPAGAAIPAGPAVIAPDGWPAFVAGMKLSGIARELAAQTALKAMNGNELVLAVPESARHLTDKAYADKLKAALEQALGRRLRIRFELGDLAGDTLAAHEKRERDAARARTEEAFRDDPFVQDIVSRFDARVRPDSIKPS